MLFYIRCRDACLQLHEDAKEHLRQQLEQEKETALQALRYLEYFHKHKKI